MGLPFFLGKRSRELYWVPLDSDGVSGIQRCDRRCDRIFTGGTRDAGSFFTRAQAVQAPVERDARHMRPRALVAPEVPAKFPAQSLDALVILRASHHESERVPNLMGSRVRWLSPDHFRGNPEGAFMMYGPGKFDDRRNRQRFWQESQHTASAQVHNPRDPGWGVRRAAQEAVIHWEVRIKARIVPALCGGHRSRYSTPVRKSKAPRYEAISPRRARQRGWPDKAGGKPAWARGPKYPTTVQVRGQKRPGPGRGYWLESKQTSDPVRECASPAELPMGTGPITGGWHPFPGITSPRWHRVFLAHS